MAARWKLVAVVVLAGAGCGAPKTKPASVDGAGGAGGARTTFRGGAAVTPESICARIFELRDARCELTAGYELSIGECQADMRRSLEERGADARQATTQAARCLLDNESCAAVDTCFAQLNPNREEQDGSPTALRTCAETQVYAPVGVPRAEWEKRRGANAKKYSDVSSTKDKPVEVCGIPAEMEWLLAARCNDGSQPFRSYDHAHASRVGNVGAGGACGSIIDLYEVPCPEATYQVFIDAYVCPKD